MSNEHKAPPKKVIARYIDENLRQVFADYANEDLPPEITDLVSILKAQDSDRAKDKS